MNVTPLHVVLVIVVVLPCCAKHPVGASDPNLGLVASDVPLRTINDEIIPNRS